MLLSTKVLVIASGKTEGVDLTLPIRKFEYPKSGTVKYTAPGHEKIMQAPVSSRKLIRWAAEVLNLSASDLESCAHTARGARAIKDII